MTIFAGRAFADSDWDEVRRPPIEPSEVRLLRDAAGPLSIHGRRYPRFPAWGVPPVEHREPTTHVRSVRRFADAPLPESAMHALLASLVPVEEDGDLTFVAPSAGAIHGCHVYAATLDVEQLDSQFLHIDLTTGTVQELWPTNAAEVAAVFEPQDWVASSSVVFFVTADLAGYEAVYAQRGLRFALLEAGFLADVIWRSLPGLGLAGCVIGGFNDARASRLLDLRGEERLAVAVACGASGETKLV